MKKINEFKKFRLLNGLTQEEVSNYLMVSQQYISKIERSDNEGLIKKSLKKLRYELSEYCVENGLTGMIYPEREDD